MIYPLIESRKNLWINSPDCPVKGLVSYMRKKGELRDTQIEAIETYLFFKFAGDNKPLADLFAEGFFFPAPPPNLDKMLISQRARELLQQNPAAWSLFQFSRLPDEKGNPSLPQLEKTIAEEPDSIDYREVIRKIFYGVSYPDYLFSLPMGAGKTFLIAALIYLDLYFAQQDPRDPKFAHNFLVLIPSGLKSSIAPSLKTIEQFDPTWVLPEPAASNIRRLLQFEVLDAPKSEKKSNRVRNPNAQKVSMLISQPDPMGLVFLVNAEKVILDRLDLDSQQALIEKTEDEKSRSANELRHLLGKIPNLGIHIDEVHHATDDEIKLRQVVTRWASTGNVVNVLGYSGTPYLEGAERIPAAPGVDLQFTQITNTVYYYPLVRAIQRFLKKPEIKTASGLPPREVIRRGVQEFYSKYGGKIYPDGAIPKLAIYCGTIERLEEEVYPFLRDELHIPEGEILKYHRGNASYKVPQEAALEFAALDTPTSKKRIILLVQIGKEGWDCRSLTGVILAQKKDSPTNMVLQIACRCLRQVEKGALETALIWLNEDNAEILQKQLKAEQRTSIQEINAIAKTPQAKTIDRFARDAYLKLPPVDFYQLRIDYGAVELETAPAPDARLNDLLASLENYRVYGQTQSGALTGQNAATITFSQTQVVNAVHGDVIRFYQWLNLIVRESFGGVTYRDLTAHRAALESIFNAITAPTPQGKTALNLLYDQERIRSAIRAAFFTRRQLQTNEQVIPQKAHLLLASKLPPVSEKNAYPSEQDTKTILDADKQGKSGEQLEQDYAQIAETIRQQYASLNLPGFANIPVPSISLAVRWKDRTLHYIPYSFAQSRLEFDFLEACLQLQDFQDKNLELYYNGERGLTEFVINCYQKKGNFWKWLGEYTPDFLILQRDQSGNPYKVLIVETKGEGFEESFKSRRAYVQSDFLRLNKDKFGYDRFEFLYIRESDDPAARLAQLAARINAFFV
ncbi:MAG: hypothetical protein KatS3mg046_421 [Bellilinea sp.]|nr:MAG: hypothetical protein KatS3mg046_421 [Bellilinea sp.]